MRSFDFSFVFRLKTASKNFRCLNLSPECLQQSIKAFQSSANNLRATAQEMSPDTSERMGNVTSQDEVERKRKRPSYGNENSK